jgi:class 3 adenylate cyclase
LIQKAPSGFAGLSYGSINGMLCIVENKSDEAGLDKFGMTRFYGAMSTSGTDNMPDSGRPPAEALASGQRTLAAIVFTDTVGFSALMSKDEERTLRLVARDLDQMKATCEAFGGQVLKSTGDGLLMLFTSAVQAVACALEIQRDFEKRNLDLPQAERLLHRIGIHLGDVFQSGGDVMGDGVNIAARLQTQAVPGGICLSKTVYDVVHNRLPFYVNDLGERKLKNIGKVTAYQISPADGDRSGHRFGVAWYRWRPWVWGGIGLLGLLFALGAVYKLGMYNQWLEHHRAHPVAANAGAPSTVTKPVATFVPPTAAAGLQEVSETEFQDASFRYMTKYDFNGMEVWIREHNWPGKATNTLAAACPQLDHLFTWAHQQMQKYAMDKPLKVIGKERTFFYWPAPFGGVKQKIVPNVISPNNEIKIATLGADQIPPLGMVGIIRELLRENSQPAGPLTLQLERELHLFIQTYHIVLPTRNPATTPPLPAASAPTTNPVSPGP